jgi:predicted RNA-binding protein with RPS1 domain
VHISKWTRSAWKRSRTFVTVGDEVLVKVTENRRAGAHHNISRRDALDALDAKKEQIADLFWKRKGLSAAE